MFEMCLLLYSKCVKDTAQVQHLSLMFLWYMYVCLVSLQANRVEQGYEDGLQLLAALMTLEDSLNYLYVLIEQAQQEDSSPGKAGSTATLQLVFKTIAGKALSARGLSV